MRWYNKESSPLRLRMTGRGRSPRLGSKQPQTKGSTNSRGLASSTRPRAGSRSAGIGSTTRTNSGSPSTRTRSLSSPARGSPNNNKSRGVLRGRGRVSIPAIQRTQPASTPPSPVKKPQEEKQRSKSKNRRPKFLDNPSAPEIVEKKELIPDMTSPEVDDGLEIADKDGEVCDNVAAAPANGHQEEEDEDESVNIDPSWRGNSRC